MALLGMGPVTQKIYRNALQDEQFLSDIWQADSDEPPSPNNAMEVTIFAAFYYGYLVAKHGPDNWAKSLK